MKEALREANTKHEALMEEKAIPKRCIFEKPCVRRKETSFRQATDVLQQQLGAKDTVPRRDGLCTASEELQEMTLHETLQSLQFLRNSTSEQLQWEFGSWKSLQLQL